MSANTVTLAHGAGGKQTSELIEKVFKAHFSNPEFTADDAAVLPKIDGKLAMTTDGFIVSPWEFNGGNIGKLSICGTVNDLSCMGAKPLYMTCAFVIEEGFPLDSLEQIAAAMEKTAKEVGVKIVAGDTKVAGKGQCDGVFITTTGVGVIQEGVSTSGTKAKAGDAVIVTGDVGRHGCTILIARDEYGIDSDVDSDCAPLWGTVESVMSDVGIALDQTAIPVDSRVKGVCGMLGLEPLYLACEGRLVIFAPADKAEAIVAELRKGKYSQNAAIIGRVTDENKGKVILETEIGTQTILPQPKGELLPRIC